MDAESRPKIPPPRTLCSFFALALIRGSFAILVHYGITTYKTPSLLFLLRTPGTVALFAISVLYLSSKDEESKLEIVNNFKSLRAYKRAALLGFFQLCGPYMLFMYAMKFLSPTLGAVFMAATPWATVLLEQLLALTVQITKGKDWNAVGSFVGAVGMLGVSVANIFFVATDTSCDAVYGDRNFTIISNGTLNVTRKRVLLEASTCATSVEITTAVLALCGATFLWSFSAVFSRLKRVSLHFLVGGVLNNAFGGMYAAILWVIVQHHINTDEVEWDTSSGSLSVLFLTIASSWGASLVLYHLYKKIGAESTNRVMCLVPLITWAEDLLFVHHHRHMFLWTVVLEAIGLFMVVAGLYLSSFRKEQTALNGAHARLLPDYVSEEEDDAGIQRRVNDLVDSVQSEEGLQESGTSSMQESAEPPMIHYADDEEEGEGELWSLRNS